MVYNIYRSGVIVLFIFLFLLDITLSSSYTQTLVIFYGNDSNVITYIPETIGGSQLKKVDKDITFHLDVINSPERFIPVVYKSMFTSISFYIFLFITFVLGTSLFIIIAQKEKLFQRKI